MKYERTLVIVAHPDDEVLGCGGTVSRLLSMGKEVHLLVLGSVTTSRYKENADEESWKKDAYNSEMEKATDFLGISSIKQADFDDNRLDTYPLLEIIKVIEGVKNRVKPDLIMTHDYTDLNVDHKITHQAVMTAFRPDIKYNKFRIMTFEILSSTECQDQAMAMFSPNCYVDITNHFSKKIGAMKCYKSEIKDYPHPRSLKGIECLARKRGMDVCVEFAEAFRVVREVY